MQANFDHSRLVRVVWKNRATRQVRIFVAANCAYDIEHARDIGEAILTAMVPCHLPLNIAMQTATLGRAPRQSDMHAHETPWENFYTERLNYVEPKRKRAEK